MSDNVNSSIYFEYFKNFIQISCSFVATLFLLIVIANTLVGCSTVQSRGQYIEDELIKEVKTKAQSQPIAQADVLALLGTPNFVPDYTSDTWYYIHRALNKRAWFDAQIQKQRIVQVKFDHSGIMGNIAIFDDTYNANTIHTTAYTKTLGTEMNFAQKFVKNLWRFNKSSNYRNRKRH